jgi:ribosomal protein S18 acetylase RimI-like enzyme
MVGEGEVYAISVDPRRWGEGIGRELLSASEEATRELSYREAGLWVLEDNPRARRFYEAGAGSSTRRRAS